MLTSYAAPCDVWGCTRATLSGSACVYHSPTDFIFSPSLTSSFYIEARGRSGRFGEVISSSTRGCWSDWENTENVSSCSSG
ncbi:hypothetical protein GOODEAATRI_025699 [Goodea atripinnis]|uniref:Uncharacterized protein n=1 Tax=Goodea atripinnis TaxID=208336 RepID=A0ABV0N4A1_9TELE